MMYLFAVAETLAAQRSWLVVRRLSRLASRFPRRYQPDRFESNDQKLWMALGRLVVRRIPDLNPKADNGQGTLFGTWRFHAFFTTVPVEVMDTVTADKTHRGHAIIEQVHADPNGSALAHLPSGVFTANAAWLVLAVMAFNLTRAAAAITGPTLAKSTTATIRRKLINIPARIASSARQIRLHLPTDWKWETEWMALFARNCGPPAAIPS